MSKLSKVTLHLAAATVVALVSASPSLADPPGTLLDIPRHQHYLETPDGDLVSIGPDFCDNADLQGAFNQFHYNIHHNSGPATLGPQGGAPGLHDGQGADMTATPCED
jgi:hypothetical protein